MAINIGENQNEQVTYVNSPDINRVLFKNLKEGASKEDIVDAVNDWLDDHPEATTTIEDGSILPVKLDSTNSASDGYVLSYNATAGKFEWVDIQSDITELKAGLSAYDVPYSKLHFEYTDTGSSTTKVTNYTLIEGNSYRVKNNNTSYSVTVRSRSGSTNVKSVLVPAKSVVTFTIASGESGLLATYGRGANIDVDNTSGIYYQVVNNTSSINSLSTNVNETEDLLNDVVTENDLFDSDFNATFNRIPTSRIILTAVDGTVGYMHPDGHTSAYNQYSYSQIILVRPGDIIKLKASASGGYGNIRVLTAFTDGVAVSSAGSDTTMSSYTVPSGINGVVVTYDNGLYPAPFVERNTDKLVIRSDALPSEDDTVPELVLPSHSFAVVGHEWNLYYDNVVDGLREPYYVFCSGINGKSYDRFLRFTPTSDDIGSHTITVNIISKITHSVVSTKTFTLVVVADSSPSKKVIFLGDSLTDAGVFEKEIQNELSDGNILSIGTRSTTVGGVSVNHEGRSGWSANDYVTNASKNDVINAFWNPSTSKFDFSYYMSQNSFSGIDCVNINLGVNGVTNVDSTLAAIDEMIASIHEYDSNIVIIISLITPPATQDGCGHHTDMFDANAWKHNELNLNKHYLTNYQGVVNNVFVSEPYFNIDRLYDFNTVTIPVSSRNPATFVCQNNNVHPSTYGYLKIADVYYANLLYRLGS